MRRSEKQNKEAERESSMQTRMQIEQEAVWQAVPRNQGEQTGWRTLSLRGRMRACSGSSENRCGFFAAQRDQAWSLWADCASSGPFAMLETSAFKDSRIVVLLLDPDGKNDPDPEIGQCTYSNGMTFALSSFALIVVQSPSFAMGGLPSKLLQSIAQGLDTAHTPMDFGVIATSKLNWCRASQGLQTGSITVALPIITNLGEQARRQSLARSGQTGKDLVVRVSQKKGQ